MSDFGSEEGEEDQGPYLGVFYFICSIFIVYLSKWTKILSNLPYNMPNISYPEKIHLLAFLIHQINGQISKS